MAWAGSAVTLPALYFRGCDLTAECRLARANVRAQLPAAAPIECRMQNEECRMADYTVVFEFLFAVFIEEIEIATSSLASLTIGAAVV